MFKRRSECPEGWTEQAFEFKLDPDDDTAVMIRRHVGMRRKAYNWAVGVIRSQVELYGLRKEAGLDLPDLRLGRARRVNPLFTLAGLRKFWNRSKDRLCVDEETGHRWWRDLSKEAAANGIADAVRAYWDWAASRKGERKGPRLGFPRFKKKGRGTQSFRIGTGTIRLADRRHVQLPRLGAVKLAENARRLDRLVNKGMARVKSATVSERADGFHVSLQTELLRPQRNHKPSRPGSKVGVDLGSRKLAVVASSDGTILERVPNPGAVEAGFEDAATPAAQTRPIEAGQPRRVQPPDRITLFDLPSPCRRLGYPPRRHAQVDDATRQNPRRHRDRGLERERHDEEKQDPRRQGPPQGARRRGTGRVPTADDIQVRMVRQRTDRG